MEPQRQEQADKQTKLKAVYWVASAAIVIAIVIEAMNTPNWLSIASRGSLLAALILLATARPAETRAKKLLIYALLAVSLGLLIAKVAGGGE